jgi:glycosyltransferase involved in cell wall biosynthesis
LAEPLVSIGLPVYNGERGLRRVLDSLLDQSCSNFELIISDNASTDSTATICREYQSGDARIRYSRNEKNMGMGWNFDRVVELSKGEFFMYAADDDWWHPDFLKVLLGDLQAHPGCGVAMSALDLVDETGRVVKPVRLDQGDHSPNDLGYFGMLLRLMTLWGGSTKSHHYYMYGLFRRNLLKQARRYVVRTFLGDRMLIATIALATHFRYIDQVLYIKTRHTKDMFQRYPNENFSRAASSIMKLFEIPFKFVFQLWRCDIIPASRKVYLPVAFLGMLKIIIVWIYLHKIKKTPGG